jgi:hypothetical protein
MLAPFFLILVAVSLEHEADNRIEGAPGQLPGPPRGRPRLASK